jgi:hypothetical protein
MVNQLTKKAIAERSKKIARKTVLKGKQRKKARKQIQSQMRNPLFIRDSFDRYKRKFMMIDLIPENEERFHFKFEDLERIRIVKKKQRNNGFERTDLGLICRSTQRYSKSSRKKFVN